MEIRGFDGRPPTLTVTRRPGPCRGPIVATNGVAPALRPGKFWQTGAKRLARRPISTNSFLASQSRNLRARGDAGPTGECGTASQAARGRVGSSGSPPDFFYAHSGLPATRPPCTPAAPHSTRSHWNSTRWREGAAMRLVVAAQGHTKTSWPLSALFAPLAGNSRLAGRQMSR